MADAAEKENIFLFVPNIIGEYFCEVLFENSENVQQIKYMK